MRESDFKTGMVVEDHDGAKGVVMMDTVDGNVIAAGNIEDKPFWGRLSDRLEKGDISRVYGILPFGNNRERGSVTKLGDLIHDFAPKFVCTEMRKLGHILLTFVNTENVKDVLKYTIDYRKFSKLPMNMLMNNELTELQLENMLQGE
jgi:hypothetical protein